MCYAVALRAILTAPCGETWHEERVLAGTVIVRRPRPLGDVCIGCRLHGVMVRDGVEHCPGDVSRPGGIEPGPRGRSKVAGVDTQGELL